MSKQLGFFYYFHKITDQVSMEIWKLHNVKTEKSCKENILPYLAKEKLRVKGKKIF